MPSALFSASCGSRSCFAADDRKEARRAALRRPDHVVRNRRPLSVIEGHWKLPILFRLLDGTWRFGKLRRVLPAATQRMLTLHLRELERDGLIHREVYREVPPKVEYSMTEMGRALEPLLRFMSQWGHANRALLVAAVKRLAHVPSDAAIATSLASTARGAGDLPAARSPSNAWASPPD
jgi:DNA-binding HxlR family transcriptional regulator